MNTLLYEESLILFLQVQQIVRQLNAVLNCLNRIHVQRLYIAKILMIGYFMHAFELNIVKKVKLQFDKCLSILLFVNKHIQNLPSSLRDI